MSDDGEHRALHMRSVGHAVALLLTFRTLTGLLIAQGRKDSGWTDRQVETLINKALVSLKNSEMRGVSLEVEATILNDVLADFPAYAEAAFHVADVIGRRPH